MTVSASSAIGSSMYSTLFFLHSSRSTSRIGRDALEISVSPRQNFLKPPPVPPMPTVTLIPLLAFWNSSAIASVMGNTVDEPSMAMILFCAEVAPTVSTKATAESSADLSMNASCLST